MIETAYEFYQRVIPYLINGLVTERPHPNDSQVVILNYSNKCQFDNIWDDVTMRCRGLIIDKQRWLYLTNPFPKFFNYEQFVGKGQLPQETPRITKKLDGSWIALYWLDDMPWCTTRGSMDSPQAQWATAYFRKNIEWKDLPRNITFMFEACYETNHIVVKYQKESLTLIGARNLNFGDESFPLENYTSLFPDIVESIPPTDLDALKELNTKNEEGFVVFYPRANLRLKIKFADYLRLHKLLTGVNEAFIWDILKNSQDLTAIVETVPDEFHKWVMEVAAKLEKQFFEIAIEVGKDFEFCMNSSNNAENRKDFAMLATKTKYPACMFALLDKDPARADDNIWKLIKPKNAKAFKCDE